MVCGLTIRGHAFCNRSWACSRCSSAPRSCAARHARDDAAGSDVAALERELAAKKERLDKLRAAGGKEEKMRSSPFLIMTKMPHFMW